MGCNNCFVQRSSTKAVSHRNRTIFFFITIVIIITTKGIHQKSHIHTSINIFFCRHSARHKIQQSKIFIHSQVAFFRTEIISRSKVLITTILLTIIRISKCIYFKWNLNFPTEKNQSHQLLNSSFHTVRHRTRPINKHNQTVIFSIWQNRNPTENIFTETHCVNFSHIQNSGLGSRCSFMLVCCLLHFKFFRQVRNNFVIVLTKL